MAWTLGREATAALYLMHLFSESDGAYYYGPSTLARLLFMLSYADVEGGSLRPRERPRLSLRPAPPGAGVAVAGLGRLLEELEASGLVRRVSGPGGTVYLLREGAGEEAARRRDPELRRAAEALRELYGGPMGYVLLRQDAEALSAALAARRAQAVAQATA